MAELSRPRADFGPLTSLLKTEHFEVAYATTDLDRARAIFAERFGMTRWAPLGGPLPEGGEIRILLGWAGGVMYELLSASGPGSEVYMQTLPGEGFAIRHHHLGFLIHDAAEWAALEAAVAARGWPVRTRLELDGFMKQLFVEVPELGHLHEYLWPEPAGVAFFDSVPSN